MKTLREVLQEAREKKVAVGHFNVSDLTALRAIFEAAQELKVPVMIGVSEGERKFVGVHEIAALVKSYREEHDFPIFLNADHTHSIEAVEEAARAGFDEILFDGSKLSFSDNAAQTKKAVELVHSVSPEIVVEGEIGYIGSSSEVQDAAPEGAALSPEMFTTAQEAADFVTATGVDVLAPAVGTMHGLTKEMAAGRAAKHVDVARIAEIAAATRAFLTLHGGSGTANEDFSAAIKAGITIIHVNTELRLAWHKGVEEGLAKDPNEIAPYKILPPAFDEIKKIVKARLELFNRV